MQSIGSRNPFESCSALVQTYKLCVFLDSKGKACTQIQTKILKLAGNYRKEKGYIGVEIKLKLKGDRGSDIFSVDLKVGVFVRTILIKRSWSFYLNTIHYTITVVV